MKKSVAITLMAVLIPAVMFSHLNVVEKDNGVLLSVDGREVDVWGMVKNRWQSLTHDCSAVVLLEHTHPVHQLAKDLIQRYSPPDSNHLTHLFVWQQGPWMLAETEFESLLPAVVTLHEDQDGMSIVPNGIWSGHTQPWVAGPHIRAYLGRQIPDVPQALLNCFKPQTRSFTAP